MADSKQFDAVIIGSGLGGLTAGALLAKAGFGVCVLERNFSLGGAASVYRIGSVTVEASLHQTSDPRNPRDVKRRILDELGILDEIEWVSTGPLYTVRGGPLGEPFTLPVGFEAAKDALAQRFPKQAQRIARFLDGLDTIHDSLWNLSLAREDHSIAKLTRGLSELAPAAADWRSSLDDVFSREFGGDEAVKCALAANLLYFGDDPKRMWFIYYALAQGAYIASGGAYIKGGSRQLSLKLAKTITRAGGVVRLGRAANAIETDSDGRVAFVRHVNRKSGEGEERIGARVVLANCAPTVAAELLPEPARAAMERAFGARDLSTSLFCAHFGLSEKPSTVGLSNYSTIVLPEELTRFDQYGASAALLGDAPKGELPVLGVANFGSIDSGLWETPPVLLSVLGLDRIGNWRGLAREAAKERRERWLDAILARLERDHPGLSELVLERSLLTAQSMQGYLNTPDGAVYGFAPLPPTEPIWAGFPRTPHTPAPGLYLASAFGGEHGFNGAMLSGAEAAKLAMNDLHGSGERPHTVSG
ncbi:MAG: NAD(P)/FAD-dependent oxidoreductase [Methylocystaceae bacterium]|nr:MAG: NAD(P)/FAD-dependent oxidoreductase [Methylocystaceae bacterium]